VLRRRMVLLPGLDSKQLQIGGFSFAGGSTGDSTVASRSPPEKDVAVIPESDAADRLERLRIGVDEHHVAAFRSYRRARWSPRTRQGARA
jgi:hypothetical protein